MRSRFKASAPANTKLGAAKTRYRLRFAASLNARLLSVRLWQEV